MENKKSNNNNKYKEAKYASTVEIIACFFFFLFYSSMRGLFLFFAFFCSIALLFLFSLILNFNFFCKFEINIRCFVFHCPSKIVTLNLLNRIRKMKRQFYIEKKKSKIKKVAHRISFRISTLCFQRIKKRKWKKKLPQLI